MLLAVDKVSCEASNAAVGVLHRNNEPLSIESIAVGPQPYSQENHSRDLSEEEKTLLTDLRDEQMTSLAESLLRILLFNIYDDDSDM